MQALRNEQKARLEKLPAKEPTNEKEQLTRAEKVYDLQLDYVEKLKGFIAELLQLSIDLLGTPPCSFAMIGFGSLSKLSSTLFSDVEFGFLLEEGKDNEEHRRYFRALTHLLHAKVIALEETPIPYSLFEYPFDEWTGVGFSFDLGGKTSLGRRYEERDQAGEKYGTRKYELIGSCSQFLEYLEDPRYFAVDRLLPIEVAHCLHITGESVITDQYKQLLQKCFQQQVQNGLTFQQKRALEQLKGNRYLESDLQKFNPFKVLDGESKLVDVKNEIYRPLDRLVEDLALFHGIYVESTWDKITALAEQNIIHPDSDLLLKILHTIALEMRLKTYHHYGRQMESVGLSLPLFADNKVAFHQGQKRLLERFYATVLPYHRALETFSRTLDKKLLCQKAFRDDSFLSTSLVLIRLGEYKEVKCPKPLESK